ADFHRVRREELRVVLIEAAPRILTAFDPPLSEKARQQLQDLGVEVRSGVRVENVDASGVRVAGELIEARTVLWGAGVQPSPIARARAVAQIRRVHLSGLVAWLTWAFVHLWYLVGFRNRIAVFLNWIWAYLISNHGARIVIGRGSRQPPSVNGRQPLVGSGGG